MVVRLPGQKLIIVPSPNMQIHANPIIGHPIQAPPKPATAPKVVSTPPRAPSPPNQGDGFAPGRNLDWPNVDGNSDLGIKPRSSYLSCSAIPLAHVRDPGDAIPHYYLISVVSGQGDYTRYFSLDIPSPYVQLLCYNCYAVPVGAFMVNMRVSYQAENIFRTFTMHVT